MSKDSFSTITTEQLRSIGDPVIITTYMRSGTHLTIDLIRKQFANFQVSKRWGEPSDSLYSPLDVLLSSPQETGWTTERFLNVLSRPNRPLLKTHHLDPNCNNLRKVQPALADWLIKKGAFLHIVRAPRKVISSFLVYREDLKGSIRQASKETIVSHVFDIWRKRKEEWEMCEHAHTFSFENIVNSPKESLHTLGTILKEDPFYREPLLPKRLKNIYHSRFNRLFTRRPESTAIIGNRSPEEWDKTWDNLIKPF